MNDEHKRLQEMLERATVPGDDVPVDLDAETSSLREGWLALGKLLEDAQSASGNSLENWQVAPRRAQRRWPLVLAVAVAASLLIAAGVSTAYRLLDGPNLVEPNPPELVQDEHPPGVSDENTPGAIPTPAPETPPDRQIAAVADPLQWDDALDEEIEVVAQAVISVQQDWYAQSGDFSVIEHGLNQIEYDVEDGTL